MAATVVDEFEVVHRLIRQEWWESERSWGSRPDGYSLHRTEADRDRFIKEYWDGMPDEIPDEYSYPMGDPEVVVLDEATYREVCKSDCGIRCYR